VFFISHFFIQGYGYEFSVLAVNICKRKNNEIIIQKEKVREERKEEKERKRREKKKREREEERGEEQRDTHI